MMQAGGIGKHSARPIGCDVLIAGGGITGLTIARELIQAGAQRIIVLEKERDIGLHASGRNSGVLHAGMYYTPDSLKARFCVEGNRMMKDFCRERGLTLNETGKVIVTRGHEEVEGLLELKRRADACGADAEIIDERQLKLIEPHATTSQIALYSPNTAVIRPREVLDALARDLELTGRVSLMTSAAFLGLEGSSRARSSVGSIDFDQFINAAGAHADKVAQLLGLAHEYRLLPFKGTYKQLQSSRRYLVRGNIYPVPDLRNPFLGIHFTKTADGRVYVGPTAIPALGRENYGLLDDIGIETAAILFREAVLFATNSGFRSAAMSEPKKYFMRFVYSEARRLLPELRLADLVASGKVGIRPQLVHWPSLKLEMDFVVLHDGNSLHVLNAVSPAFTSSMAFAKYLVSALVSPPREPSRALPI